MFERMLVPLDRSALAEGVLPHAVALASIFQSQITLLHVLDPVHMTKYARTVDPLDWQMNRAEAEAYLREMAARLHEAGLEADTVVLEGEAAEQVVEHAQSSHADLIVLNSHGQSGLSGWNVSSVVQKIILRAYTSIMLVRAAHSAAEIGSLRYERILVPVDASQRAECALPPAEALARVHDAPIILAHVVRRPEMPRRTPVSPEDADLAERLVQRNQSEAEAYLQELKNRLGDRAETRLIVRTRVGTALHDLVNQENIDLVVLSAHGYTGETRWPYGGTVVSFLAYGTTPLLIVQDAPQTRPAPAPSEAAPRLVGGQS